MLRFFNAYTFIYIHSVVFHFEFSATLLTLSVQHKISESVEKVLIATDSLINLFSRNFFKPGQRQCMSFVSNQEINLTFNIGSILSIHL